MDQLRNFTQSNRSSIVNMVYIVAAFVLVYYIVMYFIGSDTKDEVYMKNKMSVADAKNQAKYTIADAGSTKFRLGSEYTISFWMYISQYNYTTNVQRILAVYDEGILTSTRNEALLFVGLHPQRPQMIIRAGDGVNDTNANDDDYLITTTTPGVGSSPSTTTWNGTNVSAESVEGQALKPCDIMDIDTQRWLNITISVNGRILDVYLDGKLARSCIMPKIQTFSPAAAQMIVLFPGAEHYSGYMSGLQVSNYAVTPDVIYGRYQAGPYYSSSFLDYLVSKLGIKISYTGADGIKQETGTPASLFSL